MARNSVTAGNGRWIGAAVDAVVFEVFGTGVDWRTGVARESERVGTRAGVQADWLGLTTVWRRRYPPTLLRVVSGKGLGGPCVPPPTPDCARHTFHARWNGAPAIRPHRRWTGSTSPSPTSPTWPDGWLRSSRFDATRPILIEARGRARLLDAGQFSSDMDHGTPT